MNDDPKAWLGLVYRALVEESPIPSDPRRIGSAALEAIAGLGGAVPEPLPAWFGQDPGRDAAWLTALLPGEGPCWPVLTAMAWASDAPHTSVAPPHFGPNMAALMRGEPAVAPGFVLWRQPDGRLAVADLDERGSAHACGLRAGDVLLSVDGRPAGRACSEVMPFYAAPAGASFALRLERGSEALDLRLTLQPGDVPPVVARRLAGGVGYLSVRWFAHAPDPAKGAAPAARAALAGMAADGAAGLVLDLRSGLGGDAAATVGIASALSEAGVIVGLRHPDGSERTFAREGQPLWLGRPLALLVNEQTISAAEYLALALSELEGAVLVGTPTAGGLNGLRRVELADGYGLVLPHLRAFGPVSRQPRPGDRLAVDLQVANPLAAELVAGVDPPLEAARRWVLNAVR